MADHNDRNQGPDDLYDEAAPRSIFAATWFRAVLVLIVLGVIGAVAVPYILDAMNAPPAKLTGAKPSPTAPPVTTPPAAVTQATPTPAAPPPATPAPAPSSPATTPTPPPVPEKPAEKREPMVAATTPAPEPSKSDSKESSKSESKETAKSEPKAAARKQTASAAAPAKAVAKPAKATTSGQWFVQVGAFKDPAIAKKVATNLRDANYKVEESARGSAATATVAKATTSTPLAPSGSDQYDVIISGQTPDELSKRLSDKGLTAEATQNGAIVKPSLPLRDAVALSKELAVDGSKVQVRRAGGASAAAPRTSSTTTTAAGSADTLHRVSVGGFSDRATAVATLKELEAKGYKPFLTRR